MNAEIIIEFSRLGCTLSALLEDMPEINAGSKRDTLKDSMRASRTFNFRILLVSRAQWERWVLKQNRLTQGRSEMRAKDGTVTGYYSYVSGNGRVVYVNYVADKDGYRVLSNAGVPSASVTVVQEKGKKSSGSEDDFRKAFTDFTKRIEVNRDCNSIFINTELLVVTLLGSTGQSRRTNRTDVYSDRSSGRRSTSGRSGHTDIIS